MVTQRTTSMLIAKGKLKGRTRPRGQSILEVITACLVFSIGVLSLVYLLVDTASASRQSKERIKALYLAEEGLEVARAVRNRGFGNLTNGVFGATSSSGIWAFSGSSDITDGFTRTIDVSTIDGRTKLVKSKVRWQFDTDRPDEVELQTYLTDWRPTGPMSHLYIDNRAPVINVSNRYVTISLTNSSSSAVLITSMRVDWDVVPQVNRIIINGTTRYNAAFASGSTVTLSGGGASIPAGTTHSLVFRFASTPFYPVNMQVTAINGTSFATSTPFYAY